MELMVSIHWRCSVGDLTCLFLLSQNMYFTMKIEDLKRPNAKWRPRRKPKAHRRGRTSALHTYYIYTSTYAPPAGL